MTELKQQFDQLAERFSRQEGVSGGTGERRKFGSTALKVDGKIFAMLTGSGQFVVKLTPQRVGALVAQGVGTHFDSGGGRVMKAWLALEGGTARQWQDLADEALALGRKAG